MAGESSDAVAAYTQVSLRDAWELLGEKKENYPETWITLPRNRRPKDWENTGAQYVCCRQISMDTRWQGWSGAYFIMKIAAPARQSRQRSARVKGPALGLESLDREQNLY